MSYRALGFDVGAGLSIPKGLMTGATSKETSDKTIPRILVKPTVASKPPVSVGFEAPSVDFAAAREEEIARQREADRNLITGADAVMDQWSAVEPVDEGPAQPKEVPWLWVGLGVTGVAALGAFLFWRSK
ncbi:MAG: hypothetical protein DRH30_02595 [Deltaproteobacteria bacterium]|nr:MAG: hypothetical protein DRH30_02595 [Deltaproteobacteria bacterium]